MRHRSVPLGLAAALLCVALGPRASWGQAAPTADEVPATVATAWFDVLYDVVKMEQHSPPVAARAYGVAAVALYEAIVLGSRTHQPLAGQLNGWPPAGDSPLATALLGPPEGVRAREPLGTSAGRVWLSRLLDWPTVANSALARVLRGLFPTPSPESLAAITAVEQAFTAEARARVPRHVYALSVVWGRVVAEAVLVWAASDGSATLNNCPYTPPVGPGLWQPTPPAFVPTPVQPCWGQLRPFVLPSGETCAPPPPPAYAEDSGSEFYAHTRAVYDTGHSLTDEQRTIAQFWADTPGATGTPSGHWIAIMGQLARTDALSLMATADGFVRVGLAVADAFIGCWQTKYTYNLLRPVTYIQHVIDPTWVPSLSTPPFPEYTSGHATQSAAAAAVLTAMFGIRVFTDTTHTDHGLMPTLAPRTFRSFDEAAAEAALSRVYAGIHFPFGSQQGLGQGRCIGQVILDRVQFTAPGRGPW
jgi:PAP2 superfamily